MKPLNNYSEIVGTPNENAVIDLEVVDNLKKAFEFRYDDSLVDVVSKLSVSDISKKNDAQLYMPLSTPMFMADEEMTGAERGTAVHTFLQFADFESLENNFEVEKQRVINNGYITPRQGEVILKEDIDAFLTSELYQQIKSAVKVMREKKFLISINDLELDDEFSESYKGTDGMLSGIMDMVIENDDHLSRIDDIIINMLGDYIDTIPEIKKYGLAYQLMQQQKKHINY